MPEKTDRIRHRDQGKDIFNTVLHDGEVGVVDVERCDEERCFVWKGYDLISRGFSWDDVKPVQFIQDVPASAVEVVETSVGSIGNHIRWRILVPSQTAPSVVSLLMSTVTAQSMRQIAQYKQDDLILDYDDSQSSEVIVRLLSRHVCSVIHSAAEHGIVCVPIDETVQEIELFPEKLDRSTHQLKSMPMRSIYRWKQVFLPESWNPVYTWDCLCSAMVSDTSVQHLVAHCNQLQIEVQHALRRYLCKHFTSVIAEKAEEARLCRDYDRLYVLRRDICHAKAQVSMHQTSSHVTPSIAPAKNRQILTCWYKLHYTKTSCKMEHEAAKAILFRAMLSGWLVREVGKYDRSGRFIGFGLSVRQFNTNSDCYEKHRYSPFVQNRIERTHTGENGILSVQKAASYTNKKMKVS